MEYQSDGQQAAIEDFMKLIETVTSDSEDDNGDNYLDAVVHDKSDGDTGGWDHTDDHSDSELDQALAWHIQATKKQPVHARVPTKRKTATPSLQPPQPDDPTDSCRVSLHFYDLYH